MKLSGSPDESASPKAVQAKLDGFGYRTTLLSHDAYISQPGARGPDRAGRRRRDIAHQPARASARDVHLPVWGSPSTATLADMPATVACTVSHADGAALRGRPGASVALHAAVDTGWRKTPILVADMDGPEPDGPFVLFSGHHDTWYYGVMDNGSANATMLEVARLLAQGRDQWRRGFRLCFWSGHSHGRYSGSAWYVNNHWDELERRCAVHVNVNSTGGVGASVMTESAVASELAALAADVVLAETNQAHEGLRVPANRHSAAPVL